MALPQVLKNALRRSYHINMKRVRIHIPVFHSRMSSTLENSETLCPVTETEANRDANFFIYIHLLFHQEDGQCTFPK